MHASASHAADITPAAELDRSAGAIADSARSDANVIE
jgi:hypothetical protein